MTFILFLLVSVDEQELSSPLNNYLGSVANLVSTEKELYGIGILLKQPVNDITRIRKDNNRDLRAATLKMLQNWARKEQITDPNDATREKIGDALGHAGLEGPLRTLETSFLLESPGKFPG